jgi:hypothetical protein
MNEIPLTATPAFDRSAAHPDSRYFVSGNHVIFTRHRFVFYITFGQNYAGMTLIEARRKLKKYYTKSEQNDILHYLKTNNILKA